MNSRFCLVLAAASSLAVAPLAASVSSKTSDSTTNIDIMSKAPTPTPPMPKVDPNASSRLPLGPAMNGKARRAKPEGSPGEWVTNDDYPLSALRYGEEGTTTFGLAIGPSGLVTDCVILATSGSVALDSTTCRLMKERARFVPALDSRGRPVVDRFSSRMRWIIPNATGASAVQLPQPPFPLGVQLGTFDYVVEFALTPTGDVESCNVIKGDGLPPSAKEGLCNRAGKTQLKAQLNDQELLRNVRRKVRMRMAVEVEPLP